MELLKDRFQTEIVFEGQNLYTIDEKLSKILGGTFSPELVKSLFEIAKQKNKNIKQIYILTENIKDHVHTEDKEQVKETVVSTLVDEVKKDFSLEPIILPTMNASDIKDGDHIIVDRHNPLVHGDIVQKKPTQFSVLPLETEISNNERYLEEKADKSKLVTILRKEFEEK